MFWVKHSLAHLMVSAAQSDMGATYQDFVVMLEDKRLSHLLDANPAEVVGRDLVEEDLEDEANVSLGDIPEHRLTLLLRYLTSPQLWRSFQETGPSRRYLENLRC